MRALVVFLLTAASFAAHAQQPPPPPGETPNCRPHESLPVDSVMTPIMADNEGDIWVHIAVPSSGAQFIGWLSMRSFKFCLAAEGKKLPIT